MIYLAVQYLQRIKYIIVAATTITTIATTEALAIVEESIMEEIGNMQYDLYENI